jgi:Ca-activated chloride channel family protein
VTQTQPQTQTQTQLEPQTQDVPVNGLADPRLDVRQDRRLIRAHGRSKRFLLIDVVAPTLAPDPSRRRPPVNLGFVLDRSGSMGGHNKLSLAKQAVLEAIRRLEAQDRFSVVTYDDRVDVPVPATVASPAARHEAERLLEQVMPRGNTNLHAGWLTGCEQVAAGLSAEGVNRVLLLTDGLANAGITDHGELGRLAWELRRRGVTTSTFGVGTDFDEALLQAMADAGGGHFYYAGDVAEMRDHITSEVGETLDIVARETVLELVLPESVRVGSLSPFRVVQAGGRTRVLLGDMLSGQVLSVVLRLEFDYGEVGREVGIQVRVADRDGAFEAARPPAAPVSVAWAYADHAANDAQPRDVEVDRVVARLFAERAKQEAVRLNREGRYDDARGVLQCVQRRVRSYAGPDPALNGLVAELSEEQVHYAAPMAELARKDAYFRSSTLSRMRTEDGRSRKA